jgi:uncharacterized repeat protein (TIGR03803 family)
MPIARIAALALASLAMFPAAGHAQKPPAAGSAHKLKVVHSFAGGQDGASPYAGLTYHAGSLFGTAPEDGGSGFGVAFQLDPATGDETVLHSFAGGTDGQAPFGGLVYAKGAFYGTTTQGGASNNGTVFALNPQTQAETVLYSFAGGTTDGAFPASTLTYQGGFLYGTTNGGGTGNLGTLFQIDLATGAETVLHSFAGGTDGARPFGGLVDAAGTLYGATSTGGAADSGTLFAFDISTAAEAVLYSFTGGADGEYPYAGLIYQSGLLYGTAVFGGASGNGVAFSFDPATNAETVLYSFKGGLDGAAPYAGLLYQNGTLYGTTYYGGGMDNGTVFSIDATTGAETVLARFKGNKAPANPYAGVIFRGKTLYGTTQYGGAAGLGAVFKLTP